MAEAEAQMQETKTDLIQYRAEGGYRVSDA